MVNMTKALLLILLVIIAIVISLLIMLYYKEDTISQFEANVTGQELLDYLRETETNQTENFELATEELINLGDVEDNTVIFQLDDWENLGDLSAFINLTRLPSTQILLNNENIINLGNGEYTYTLPEHLELGNYMLTAYFYNNGDYEEVVHLLINVYE